jgi:hypothetical protein
MASLTGLEQWWTSLLSTGELPSPDQNNRRMVQNRVLLTDAKAHNRRNSYLNDTELGRSMGEMGCIHKSNGRAWCWVILPLREARQRARVGGDWEWLARNLSDWNEKPIVARSVASAGQARQPCTGGPFAGLEVERCPPQAALSRVEKDGCHSSPRRHVRNYGTPPLPT